eukprot:jgi/Ulvmu1/7213/UM034_0122.1
MVAAFVIRRAIHCKAAVMCIDFGRFMRVDASRICPHKSEMQIYGVQRGSWRACRSTLSSMQHGAALVGIRALHLRGARPPCADTQELLSMSGHVMPLHLTSDRLCGVLYGHCGCWSRTLAVAQRGVDWNSLAAKILCASLLFHIGGRRIRTMTFPHLLIVCALMFVGPMVTGIIPLACNVAGNWLKWMELLGAGVMLSSAFAVVLPEGFAALHSTNHQDASDHNGIDRTEDDPLLGGDDHDHQHPSDVPHWLPGLALLAGFLTMMLFEFVHHGHDHKPADKGMPAKVRDQLFECSKAPCGHSHFLAGASSGSQNSSVLTALLVHAAADGLAVGIASMSTSVRLAVSIGFAMVLHKGPVAFGLSAYLIGQRESAAAALMDLVMFAVTSPIAALVSYFLLRQVSGSASGTFVAVCVLFSAGTFVYAAAVHMLPDFSGKAHSLGNLGVLCLGAAVPCLINLFHIHDH